MGRSGQCAGVLFGASLLLVVVELLHIDSSHLFGVCILTVRNERMCDEEQHCWKVIERGNGGEAAVRFLCGV